MNWLFPVCVAVVVWFFAACAVVNLIRTLVERDDEWREHEFWRGIGGGADEVARGERGGRGD